MNRKNNVKTLGLVIFAIGIFSMHFLMTANFWFIVFNIIPDNSLWGIVPSTSPVGFLAWAIGPPIGAVLMVVGGFIYGIKSKEEA
ncbi:MAG: hypothetical protein ACFFCW_29690 [Candidatus Hodarchaeota archaeon]